MKFSRAQRTAVIMARSMLFIPQNPSGMHGRYAGTASGRRSSTAGQAGEVVT